MMTKEEMEFEQKRKAIRALMNFNATYSAFTQLPDSVSSRLRAITKRLNYVKLS